MRHTRRHANVPPHERRAPATGRGEIWEAAFADKALLWGREPTKSAVLAADTFAARGVRDVLVPGVGYGRNALPFLARGMAVTGVEISATAIGLARSALGLTFPIHHGSVTDLPFDDATYGGVFAYGLAYLLDAPARAKVYADCARQLAPGGAMVFTLIAKTAPMYGKGTRVDGGSEDAPEDRWETHPGMRLTFFDEAAVRRELGAFGLVDVVTVDEPNHGGTLPFLHALCVP